MASLDESARDLFRLLTKGATVPAALRRDLLAAFEPPAHPHVALVEAVEIIFDNVDTAPVELRQIGADAADALADTNAGGMRDSGRGTGISNALRATAGVKARAAPTITVRPRREIRAEEEARRAEEARQAEARANPTPAPPPTPPASRPAS